MGRTAKFTFPVPGRKHKKPVPGPPPEASTPLTKAQKILGIGELYVEPPIPSKDHSRFWETKSNSGISISISESTATYASDAGLGRLDEGEVVHGVSGRHARWDEESAILPRGRNGSGSRGGIANDTLTDASSIRRQRSSSTINTYYDKSKVPLSISQQTASSAMAKGLPTKASALLDMDGSYDTQPKERKKKPSRLDLSYLIPKTPKYLTLPETHQKNLVLGPDMMTRSPSVMSVSPDIAAPSAQQAGDRGPRKKLTMETLRDHRPEPMAHLEPPRMRTASSVNELHNLYEHYEQRSFDEMMGREQEGSRSRGASQRCGPSIPAATVGREYLSPYSSLSSRATPASRDGSSSLMSTAETPTTSLTTPSSVKSRPTDTASVSSRHTRTSKASKRTDRSMTDLDLRQNSVLSLSSDSEDDYDDRRSTSLSFTASRPSDSLPSPSSPDISRFPRPPSPKMVDNGSMDLPLRHFGPALPEDRTRSSPIESPDITPPRIGVRTSSLSVSSAGTQKAGSSRPSRGSPEIARSATAAPSLSSARSDDTLREFRPIALIPAQGFRYQRNSQQQGSTRRVSTMRNSNASDQSRSLSPTSIDFYLQSQHNSVTFDSGSIRSGHSTGTTGAASFRSSIGSSIAGDDGNGRFIAVTRQEEMLLAALRKKRARMRDEVITEFGEDHDGLTEGQDAPLQQCDSGPGGLQPLPSAPFQPPPSGKQRLSSDSKRSSGRHVSRNSSMSTVRLAPLHEQPFGEQQQQQPLQPPPVAPSLRKKSSNLSAKSSRKEEQVPLYADHRVPKRDALAMPEPSPDLDDFSDFDYLGSGIAAATAATSASDTGSSSIKSQTSSSQLREADLFPAVPVHRHHKTGNTTLVTLPRSRFNPTQQQGRRGGEVEHVRADGGNFSNASNDNDAEDIPRPDSPISPVADFPSSPSQLPKKKQVRLSAVGYRPMEAGLWGDDG